MTKRSFLSLIIVVSFSFQIFAQQSAAYTSSLVDYQKALSLYNNQQYRAAQSMFSDVKKTANETILQSNCTYYIANCAVRLNQQNADQLIENFVKEYPTSTKRNTAFIDVADYYFENSKYAYASKWYKKVDENALARKERENFYFNYGYTAFTTKNYKTAKKYLSRVESSQEFGSQAKYYIGFMAYEGDDYDKANEYFEQVNDQERYKEKLSYYQADLNFKLGKFENAIQLAKERLESSDEAEVSELSKIIGESYFNLKKYKEAIPYLKEYKDSFFKLYKSAIEGLETHKIPKIQIIGNKEINENIALQYVKNLNLEQHVTFLDHMPQFELYNRIEKAKYVLLINGNTAYWWCVFAKLIDYIALEKNVLAFVPEISEARKELIKANTATFLQFNKSDSVQKLRDLLTNSQVTKKPNSAYCRRYLASSQVKAFINVFKELQS